MTLPYMVHVLQLSLVAKSALHLADKSLRLIAQLFFNLHGCRKHGFFLWKTE